MSQNIIQIGALIVSYNVKKTISDWLDFQAFTLDLVDRNVPNFRISPSVQRAELFKTSWYFLQILWGRLCYHSKLIKACLQALTSPL